MIYDKLFDWQKKIVDAAASRSSYGLFLDCGLGKTPVSLALAEKNKCDKVIVITINSKATEGESVSSSWWDWGKQAGMAYRIANKNTIGDGRDLDMIILNYESLFKRNTTARTALQLREYITRFISQCTDKRIALIIDESHKIKNLQSLQTKAIQMIQRNLYIVGSAVYTYLASGTPFTTGFVDLYSQLKLLGCPMTKGNFVDEFCIRGNRPGLLGYQQPIVGYKNVDALYDLVHKYAITIKSKEVIDLPEQVFQYHCQKQTPCFDRFTYPKLEAKKINEQLSITHPELLLPENKPTKVVNPFYRNLDYPDIKYFASTTGLAWLRARQASIGFQGNAEESVWYDRSRLNELKRFLEQNEDNYVLFYNYTPELLEIYDICKDLGYNTDVYCGEVHSLFFYERYCQMKDYEKLHSKKNIILANFASGSTGKNWQEYNHCIIFSMPLYKDWEQGLKRIHRIGQKSTVIYHLFYQKNWLDLGMMKALEEKIDYSEEMFKAEMEAAVNA